MWRGEWAARPAIGLSSTNGVGGSLCSRVNDLIILQEGEDDTSPLTIHIAEYSLVPIGF